MRGPRTSPDSIRARSASVLESSDPVSTTVVTPHRSSMSSSWAESCAAGSFAGVLPLGLGEMHVAVLEARDHEQAFAVDARRVRGHRVRRRRADRHDPTVTHQDDADG